MAAMVHELVGWSSASEQCDLHRFIEKYGRYVPLLVRIADGYAGRDEFMHLFAQNEVSWPALPFLFIAGGGGHRRKYLGA